MKHPAECSAGIIAASRQGPPSRAVEVVNRSRTRKRTHGGCEVVHPQCCSGVNNVRGGGVKAVCCSRLENTRADGRGSDISVSTADGNRSRTCFHKVCSAADDAAGGQIGAAIGHGPSLVCTESDRSRNRN